MFSGSQRPDSAPLANRPGPLLITELQLEKEELQTEVALKDPVLLAPAIKGPDGCILVDILATKIVA